MGAVISEGDKVRATLCCTACHVVKNVDDFSLRKYASGNTIRRQPCKECWKPIHAKAMRGWRQTPVGKVSVKSSLKKWHVANPDYEGKRSKLRYLTDPVYRERVKQSAKQHQLEHPEYYRAAAKLRRARMAGAGGIVTLEETKALFEDYSGLCVYCMGKATELDHVIPISKGGTHTADNLVPSCKSCNCAKWNRPLLVFLAMRRGVSNGSGNLRTR